MQNHLSWQIFGLLKAEVAILPPNIDRNPKNQTKTFLKTERYVKDLVDSRKTPE